MYIVLQVIVKRVVEEVQLQMSFNLFPQDPSITGFYFALTATGPVPVPSNMEEAYRTLPRLIETGICNNRPLQSLESEYM